MALTYLLALSHKMLAKDRLVREGRWHERLDYIGMGVTGRTLGLVGLGNIGREICTLAQPFGIRCIAADPFVDAAEARAAGTELVELDQLLQRADYICICCALTDQTHHLIGERELSLMKESAYLINTPAAPSSISRALTRALQRGQIGGAGLDVFEQSLYPRTSRCWHSPTKPSSPARALLDRRVLPPHRPQRLPQPRRSGIRSPAPAPRQPSSCRAPRFQEKLNRYRAIG